MRVTPVSRRLATAVVSAALVFGLAACSSDDDGADDSAAEESTTDISADQVADDAEDATAAEDTADDTDADSAEDTPSADGFTAAEWAHPVTAPGEQIATLEGENFMVEVYQVGVASAPKDGFLVDPDTDKPILAEGDDIVFVNYVVTNTSDAPIDLSASLVDVDATYEDWPYLQGMDSITDRDLFDEMGVNRSGPGEHRDPSIYPLQPGESFSYGDNFMYRTDVPVVFEARLTPVDEGGDLISDLRQEVSTSVTLS